MVTEQVVTGSTIIVDLENRAGTKQSSGPIATAFALEFDNPLSEPGSFSFRMPAADPKAADVTIKLSAVKIYLDGEETFAGIVESKRQALGSDGVLYLTVTGRDLSAELAEQNTYDLDLESASAGVTNAPSTILASGTTSTWSLDTTNGDSVTANTFYGRFDHASKLYALAKLSEHLGEHFVYRPQLSGNDRKIIWYQDIGTASGIRAIQGAGEMVKAESNTAICFITSLERVEDGYELVNRMFPYGAGQGKARLTLAGSTYTGDIGTPTQFAVNLASNLVDRKYTGYAYPTATGPVFAKAIEFKEIAPISNTNADLQAAANMLCEAAFRYLERYGDVHEFFSLEVIGLDYDSLLPGQTIRVIYYEADADGTVIEDIDTDLIVLRISVSVDQDGAKRYQLLVSTIDRYPDHDAKALASEMEQGKVFTTLPQMGPNSYTTGYQAFVGQSQASDYATLNFWFGDEVVQLQQVLLRIFKNPLFSTQTTVSSASTSSGASSTSSSGASSSSTTSGGSSHNHTIGDHGHAVGASQGTGGRNVGLFTGGGFYYEGADVGVVTIPTTNNPGQVTSSSDSSHTHGMDHTHNIDHTHNVTPDVDSTYGLFRESAAQTFYLQDIEFQVNGTGAWTTLDTGSGSGNSRTFDITASVYNSQTFRPIQEDNYITFRQRLKTIVSIDGDGATVTVEVAAGMLGPLALGSPGDHSVTITGTSAYNGTYTVTGVNSGANTFTFASAATGTETSISNALSYQKTAMLDCFLSIRNIIQSVAYL